MQQKHSVCPLIIINKHQIYSMCADEEVIHKDALV